MKKISRFFGLLLLGVVLGLPLGFYLVQYKFIAKEKAIGMVNEEGLLDEFAKKEFAYADPQNAREALTYAIKTYNAMQGISTLSGWREKLDLGWCYAELSLIEESAGNTNSTSDYMSRAQQILKGSGLNDPSESHIREILQRRRISNQLSSVQAK
jgi:hypothetical protein